ALGLESSRGLVDLDDRETVSVHILEKGVPRLPPSPRRLRRRDGKMHSALRPRFEDRVYVFSEKAESGILPDVSFLYRPFGGNNERDAGRASGRGREDPPAHAGNVRIDRHLEAEPVDKEPKTPLLISDPHRRKIQPEKGL